MKTDIAAKAKHQNAVTIIIGALLLGFLWRTRGSSGWGSSWGLLTVGLVFTLFIIVVNGARKKMNLSMLALTALSFMLTVPSWGTLRYQICGVLYRSELDFDAQAAIIEIPVLSGVFLMLCLGFGVATLYGIMLGRGYSDVRWRWWHFAVLVGVFFAAKYAAMATVSHWILDLIQPQSSEFYASCLKEAGIDGTVYELYMQHFNDLSWAKKVEGGRNYFSEIQTIASVFAAAAALIAARFVIKDKRAAKTGLVVSCAFAFSITVSDLLFFLDYGGYHMQNVSYLPQVWDTWALWEYFTGFIAGAAITAFLISLKEKEDVTEHLCAQLPDKVRSASYIVLGYIALIGITIVRPVFERMEDSRFAVAAALAAAAVAAVTIAVSIKKFGYRVDKTDVYGFSAAMLLVILPIIAVVYLFVGVEDKPNFRYVFDGSLSHLLFCISFVAVEGWGIATVLKNRKALKTNSTPQKN